MDAVSIANWLADFAHQVAEHSTELTELDRQIGDADHGSNLDRGMRAVVDLDPASFGEAADLAKKAGMTLVSTVGGASGPLYGTFFLRVAASLPEGELTPEAWAIVMRTALEGVQLRGKAAEGDKTMVDALAAATAACVEAAERGDDLATALHAGAAAAARGRDATIAMVARKGRASYLGERSRGHQDPGATSMTLLLEAAARTLV